MAIPDDKVAPDAARPDPGLDPAAARKLRLATRRGFAIAGGAIVAGAAAWRWLASSPAEMGLPWPLRRALEANERLSRAAFRAARLAPEFGRSLARIPPINGRVGMMGRDAPAPGDDPSAWRLAVEGGRLGRERRLVGLDEIRALPRFEQVTELKCIEGWSVVVRWAGARLADLAATTGLAARSGRPYAPEQPPGDLHAYVGLATPDRRYYVGLDAPSALHPQTLLCYEMDGRPLSADHGAPLRLVIPVKYGIKNIKRIGTIRFTDRRPPDYWAERGYDWYAGH